MPEPIGPVDDVILPAPKTNEQRELNIALQNYFKQTNDAITFLLRRNIVTKTAAYTIDGSDHIVLVDTTGGNVTITLPVAAKHDGQEFIIKKIIAANTLTVDGDGSEAIDGVAAPTFTVQYDFIKIISDGSNWHIIGQND